MGARFCAFARQNSIALVALSIAIGGTSYAATSLPFASVGGKQLKHDAVTSPKIKDGSLLALDFAAGQLPQGQKGDGGPKGDAGPAGGRGPQGETGPQGPIGPPGKDGAQGPAGKDGVQGSPGKDGVQGPAGKDGSAGAPGKDGANGATNLIVRTASVSVVAKAVTVTALCKFPEHATGGGGSWSNGSLTLSGSTPANDTTSPYVGSNPTAWSVSGMNTTSNTETLQAYVVCASP